MPDILEEAFQSPEIVALNSHQAAIAAQHKAAIEFRNKNGLTEDDRECFSCGSEIDQERWEAIKGIPKKLCRICVGLPPKGKKRRRKKG